MTRYDAERLKILIENHARHTGSARARMILENWSTYRGKFKKVMPTEYRRALRELMAENENRPMAVAGE
jgi:glutamate synthase (NADPH/NADH) large chain